MNEFFLMKKHVMTKEIHH